MLRRSRFGPDLENFWRWPEIIVCLVAQRHSFLLTGVKEWSDRGGFLGMEKFWRPPRVLAMNLGDGQKYSLSQLV